MKEKISGIKPFKIFLRRFASAVLVLSLMIAVPVDNSALAASASTVAAAAEGPSKEEIVLYVQEHPSNLASYSAKGLPLNGYTIGYRVKPQLAQPYVAGALSDDELICALNTIKTIRYIAGLPDDIYLSDEYNS